MTEEIRNQQEIAKYRKLFGITESDDLSALRTAYAGLNEKIQAQIRSKDRHIADKGYENRDVLEKAFTAVAGDICSRERSSQNGHYGDSVSVEYASMRVGFQVLEGGSKFATKKVTSFAGIPVSFKTNNILSASWPAGKLNIYGDYLDLECLLGSFQLQFRDIAAIEKAWYIPFGLRLSNKDDAAESVHVFGWGLQKTLKGIVRKNRLPLKLKY